MEVARTDLLVGELKVEQPWRGGWEGQRGVGGRGGRGGRDMCIYRSPDASIINRFYISGPVIRDGFHECPQE